MIVNIKVPSGRIIPTCDVHLMAPCPCRACGGEGFSFCYPSDPCLVCDGDGCDPEVREDCEPEVDDAAP